MAPAHLAIVVLAHAHSAIVVLQVLAAMAHERPLAFVKILNSLEGPLLPSLRVRTELYLTRIVLQVLPAIAPEEHLAFASINDSPLERPVRPHWSGKINAAIVVPQILAPMAPEPCGVPKKRRAYWTGRTWVVRAVQRAAALFFADGCRLMAPFELAARTTACHSGAATQGRRRALEPNFPQATTAGHEGCCKHGNARTLR